MGLEDINLGIDTHKLSVRDIFASMDKMKTGIAVYDGDLKLLFANKTIRGYLPTLYEALDAGFSMLDAIKAQTKVMHPDMEEQESEDRAATIYAMIKNSGTMEANTPAGLRLKSTYERTARGSYILITSDVTDHAQYEAQLAKDRLEADTANTAKSEFLANMSHEIRTPLSGVFMAAQLLQQKLRVTNQTEMSDLADILVSSASHLSTIINDVLDMSKIESGQIDIVPQEASLTKMLSNLKKSQGRVAQEMGLELNLVIDPHLPEHLIFDPVRVRQSVTNLVSNALKFTHSGSVTIAAFFEAQSGQVTLHVADTGNGIAAEDQGIIFGQFMQAAHETSKAHIGTGLGLTISRKLARLMDGDITLVSELGKGSIFTLTFATQPQICQDRARPLLTNL